MGVTRPLAKRAFLALPKSIQPLARYYLSGRSRKILQVTKGTVAADPCKGMRYVRQSLSSNYCPKLLGTYEMELWQATEQVVAHQHRTVIDIGAAEGYYAVGFAKRPPATKVVCFEAETHEHHFLRKLATLNGVQEPIELHALYTPMLLNDALQAERSSLVVCDVDGGEYELLGPDAVSRLRHADILVELHDFLRPGISETIRQRFGPTHMITLIEGRERTPQDCPLRVLGDWKEQAECMAEGRHSLQE